MPELDQPVMVVVLVETKGKGRQGAPGTQPTGAGWGENRNRAAAMRDILRKVQGRAVATRPWAQRAISAAR